MQSDKPTIKTIFLIDDDEDDCIVFKLALNEIQEDIRLYYCTHCENAIGVLNSLKPDLLFLDINLPRINGIEFLQHLKESTMSHKLPIVMYSSSELPRELAEAYQYGASLYFRKPSNVTLLIRSLQCILSMPWRTPDLIRNRYARNGKYEAFREEVN